MEHYPAALLDETTTGGLHQLERSTRAERHQLMEARKEVSRAVREGADLQVPTSTAAARQDDSWRVAPPPADLTYRLVELATPASPEHATAALASGADVWVADLEDMLVPTQARLLAAHRTIEEVAATRTGDPKPKVPTLMVRPRGLHLVEGHLEVDGEPASAPVVDTWTFLVRCARTLLDNGTAPYLYLPKVETAAEARWWDRMIGEAEELLGLPAGCVRVSVLVETVQAMYELEEIVHDLRERITGLAAGRWDYVFSHVRAYGHRPDHLLPDRDGFTMNTKFLRSYTDVLIRVAQRRGVQAIGGPVALASSGPFDDSAAMTHAQIVRDKAREARQGFDGAWVLHPALAPVAREPFEERDRRRSRGELAPPERPSGEIDTATLHDVSTIAGSATLTGVRTALRSSLTYLTGWLAGEGTTTLEGHIEDFGTVELARMQLWQWLLHGQRLAEGPQMSPLLLRRMLEDEVALLRRRGVREDLVEHAARLLQESVVAEEPPAFLSQRAYEVLLAVEAGEPAAEREAVAG